MSKAGGCSALVHIDSVGINISEKIFFSCFAIENNKILKITGVILPQAFPMVSSPCWK